MNWRGGRIVGGRIHKVKRRKDSWTRQILNWSGRIAGGRGRIHEVKRRKDRWRRESISSEEEEGKFRGGIKIRTRKVSRKNWLFTFWIGIDLDFLYLTKRFSESFDQCRITVHGPAAGQPHSGHPQPVACGPRPRCPRWWGRCLAWGSVTWRPGCWRGYLISIGVWEGSPPPDIILQPFQLS